MKPILTTSIASILVFAAFAGIGLATLKDGTEAGAGADEALLHHGTAGDHGTPGMERPAFPPAEGAVPTAQKAESLEQVRSLHIHDDEGFVPANGVRGGSGTLEDPYRITGFYVTGDLFLADTDACVEIAGNYIRGQLTLNWNGQCVFVHHNYVADLRVNENVKRTGYATGGLIEQNKIGYLGQLRHYDGEFRHNVVGPRPGGGLWDPVLETVPFGFADDPRIANIDGFNQGLIHHNTFHGSVDLDFHGHHHGTGFFAPHSHYHGDDMERYAEHDHDHSDRWTSVSFTDNKVVDPEGYGLRYEDQNHRGDDRTARSESLEELDMPHVHHTHVVIAGNVVEGAPLWVDVYHADDENHKDRLEGKLEIVGNTVTVRDRSDDEQLLFFDWSRYFPQRAGISVWAAKEVDIRIEDNTLSWTKSSSQGGIPVVDDLFRYEEHPPAAVAVHSVRDAHIDIRGNHAAGFTYGVFAHDFDEKTTWRVVDNDMPDVWYDESVANEPRRE